MFLPSAYFRRANHIIIGALRGGLPVPWDEIKDLDPVHGRPSLISIGSMAAAADDDSTPENDVDMEVS